MVDRSLLTPRELEAYKLLLRGYTIPQTADIMHVAPATVSTWRQLMYQKFLMNSQPELMANRIAELEGTLRAVKQLLMRKTEKALQDAINMIKEAEV